MAKTSKQRNNEQLATFYGLASRLAKVSEADGILVWLPGPMDLEGLKSQPEEIALLIGSDDPKVLEAAVEAGLDVVNVDSSNAPIYEKLGQALVQSVADDLLSPGAEVLAVYSQFEQGHIDSVSFIRLDEHLGKLTVRDLRKLQTKVPLETLKLVLDLAIDIGREGREGKPVGTLFVVGDSRKVMTHTHPTGFDPVKGYTRKERNLADGRVREGIREVAQLDGAFIVSADATVEACCQLIATTATEITLSKGLGTRHWAAAAITKNTNAVAITVSESSGTVRIFEKGEVVLRVEPFRRAMKWTDFEVESDAKGDTKDG